MTGVLVARLRRLVVGAALLVACSALTAGPAAAAGLVAAGSQITLTGTLSGLVDPTGTYEFRIYGPGASGCGGGAVFSSSRPVHGNGVYRSATFTAPATGTYRYRYWYSGDARHAPIYGPCGALGGGGGGAVGRPRPPATRGSPPAPVVAGAGVPGQASAPVAVGGLISDTAVIGDRLSPAGLLTFRLYAPHDPACAGRPLATVTRTVGGLGTYRSGGLPTSVAGTYRFALTYAGRADRRSVTMTCAAAHQQVLVTRARPVLTSTVVATATAGQAVSGTVTLSGAFHPGGALRWRLFGPADPACGGAPVATATLPVVAATTALPALSAGLPGDYRLVTDYTGDAANLPVAGGCATAAAIRITSTAIAASAAVTHDPAVADRGLRLLHDATDNGVAGVAGLGVLLLVMLAVPFAVRQRRRRPAGAHALVPGSDNLRPTSILAVPPPEWGSTSHRPTQARRRLRRLVRRRPAPQ